MRADYERILRDLRATEEDTDSPEALTVTNIIKVCVMLTEQVERINEKLDVLSHIIISPDQRSN